MSKATMVVYTCDVCGRQVMRDIEEKCERPSGWEEITSPYHSVYLMCSRCSSAAKRLFDKMLEERKDAGLSRNESEAVQE